MSMSSLSTPIVIETPDVSVERNDASLMLQIAQAIAITTDAGYLSAGEDVKEIARRERIIEAKMDPLCDLTNRAHKGMTGLRAELLAPLKQAREIISRKLWTWEKEREKLRQAEQARLEREARERATDSQIAKAAALDSAGHHEAAEAVLNRPVQAPVVAPPAAAKIAGYTSRTEFTFEIVAPSEVGRVYCAPDEAKIRKLVKAMGMEAEKMVGGIRVFEAPRQAIRRS